MKRNYFWGILLIAIGTLGILDRVFHINLNIEIWPLIVIAAGLCFEGSYFTRRNNPGVLVPGGILTTIGALFIFETITNWQFSEYTWPVYTLAVAVGLFQLYWFGGKQKGLLVPVGILMAVTIISFISMICGNFFDWLDSSAVVPIILVVVGIAILFGKGRDKE